MKPKYFFEKTKLGYDEYLKIIEQMLGNHIGFFDKECIERGAESLGKITEKEKQQKLLSTSIYIDKVFSSDGAQNKNCAVKLPIILKCADLIANYGDKINALSMEELVLISYFYSTTGVLDKDTRFPFFLDKELLRSVQEKNGDYYVKHEILTVIDMKLSEFDIDSKSKEEIANLRNEIIYTVKNITTEEILGMVDVQGRINETMNRVKF